MKWKRIFHVLCLPHIFDDIWRFYPLEKRDVFQQKQHSSFEKKFFFSFSIRSRINKNGQFSYWKCDIFDLKHHDIFDQAKGDVSLLKKVLLRIFKKMWCFWIEHHYILLYFRRIKKWYFSLKKSHIVLKYHIEHTGNFCQNNVQNITFFPKKVSFKTSRFLQNILWKTSSFLDKTQLKKWCHLEDNWIKMIRCCFKKILHPWRVKSLSVQTQL